MLYHVSPVSDLKILKPRISTHGKPYVYAIRNISTGLLFGAKWDDFDFIVSTDKNGVAAVYECYPNAFMRIYKGKKCSLYIVDDDSFHEGRTSWSAELVSEYPVPVRAEIKITDLYERLIKEESLGHLKIYKYRFNTAYKEKITTHITDRLKRFNIDLDECLEWDDKRFSIYHRKIIEELRNNKEGLM